MCRRGGFSIFPVLMCYDWHGCICADSGGDTGIIAEFVNPKYADAERRVFKKPTRLETMMQDLPKLFMQSS